MTPRTESRTGSRTESGAGGRAAPVADPGAGKHAAPRVEGPAAPGAGERAAPGVAGRAAHRIEPPTAPVDRAPDRGAPVGVPRSDDTGRPDDTPTGPIGDAGAAPAEVPRAPTLLEQMGGVSGMVASAVPVVAFVIVQAVLSNLTVSLVTAIGVAVAIAGWRMVRGEALQPAVAGLFGVAVCAFVAWRTGEARGFFLLGIWTSLVYGGVFLLSVLVRRPLVGVIWHAINGQGQDWRRSRSLRRAFDLATLAWVVVFGARYVVQRWLYDSPYADDLLGWVRLAMGLPLAVLAALVTIWAIRRSQRELAPA